MITDNIVEAFTPDAWSAYVDIWTHGWAAGIEEGRRREHEELAAIQRAAVRSVRAAATLPPRDADADRARAEKTAAYWAQRRGEGMTA